jgi:hypothetical protein
MTMFQVEDIDAARERVSAEGVREVFEVPLEDMREVHLHPGDMRGAIVSLSQPSPPEAWRWGGPDWGARSAPVAIVGGTIAVSDPEAVAQRWERILGASPSTVGVEIVGDERDRGLVEIVLADDGSAAGDGRAPFELGGVRFSFRQEGTR